jgi:hypothetical protein
MNSTTKTCRITGCADRMAIAGLCRTHHRAWRSAGSPPDWQPADILEPSTMPVPQSMVEKHVLAQPEEPLEKVKPSAARQKKRSSKGGGSESEPGKGTPGVDNVASSRPIQSEIFPPVSGEVVPPAEKPLSPAQQQQRDRERIRKADPIGFLIQVMSGHPVPVYDIAGNIVRYDHFDPVARAAAADRMLKRIVPELKSVELNTGDGGIQFTLAVPFAVPGSARPEPRMIEARITHDEIQQGIRRVADAVIEQENHDDDR